MTDVLRLSFPRRLYLNCVGCGHEAASVAIGDPHDPDETYGDHCWSDDKRWGLLRPPDHTHLDGHGCEDSR